MIYYIHLFLSATNVAIGLVTGNTNYFLLGIWIFLLFIAGKLEKKQ